MKVRRVFILALMAMGMLHRASSAETIRSEERPHLWSDPGDVAARDLTYGIGGLEHYPSHGPFRFVKEDMDGNSPKFIVKDAEGTSWKVKVGAEARPETVVTRFLWAVGYVTDEDYLVPRLEVENLPRLKRGREFVSGDGIVMDARWERMIRKKASSWKWKHNPYSGTRELNGLRVLMALFNNYDMKDSQNSVYQLPDGPVMVVSDLGATLGPTDSYWPRSTPRGALKDYKKAKFVTKVRPQSVDFAAPSWPMMFGVFPMLPLPYGLITSPARLFGHSPMPNVIGERWIGRNIPREDVRWIAGILGQLSPEQVRDAFRAGNYSPQEIDAFAAVVLERIRALKGL